jgi:hypothetical protein
MLLRLRILLLIATCALLVPAFAQASGGSYSFDGGTAKQQAQVHAALEASAFNWSLVPATIKIHIAQGVDSEATKGELWLDSDLLNSGRYSWGTIQHEYAHQVDYYLLTDAMRAQLLTTLGGTEWCHTTAGLGHSANGCERFASTLAWAYWSSADNALKPLSTHDESSAMASTQFRALLAAMIGAPSTGALLSRRVK